MKLFNLARCEIDSYYTKGRQKCEKSSDESNLRIKSKMKKIEIFVLKQIVGVMDVRGNGLQLGIISHY